MNPPLWSLDKTVLRFTGSLPLGASFSVSLRGSGDCGIGNGDANRDDFILRHRILKAPVSFCRQVHKDSIFELVRASGETPPFDGYDGLWSPEPVNAGVFTADCLAVALISSEGQRALVHSGWRGTALNIAGKAAEMMISRGADPGGIRAVFGPSGHSCCYNVGSEFREIFPEETLREQGDRLFFDNSRAVQQQLLFSGLREEYIFVNPYCTICNNDIFFSYRKEQQQAGRMFNFLSG